MSWGIKLIGKPENIVKALNSHSESLTGSSKIEFDSVKPNIEALVLQNFNQSGPPILHLEANGHVSPGVYGNCQVKIVPLDGTIVD